MSNIHQSAVIEPGAVIDPTAIIGPFCVIGAGVTIKAGVKLDSHVNVQGITEIGENTHVQAFTSLGTKPQDLKYAGEKTKLVIGKNNSIREHVTMNTGTVQGGSLTKVGDNNLFMVGAHVAHDCIVGSNCIFANNATIGGHVVVEDFAIIGGLAAVHQHTRIGKHSMIGGVTGVVADVIPYGNIFAERGSLQGLNLVGLKRRGFERAEISALRAAFEKIFESDEGTIAERIEHAKKEFGTSEAVKDLLEFLGADSSRPLCKPKAANG